LLPGVVHCGGRRTKPYAKQVAIKPEIVLATRGTNRRGRIAGDTAQHAQKKRKPGKAAWTNERSKTLCKLKGTVFGGRVDGIVMVRIATTKVAGKSRSKNPSGKEMPGGGGPRTKTKTQSQKKELLREDGNWYREARQNADWTRKKDIEDTTQTPPPPTPKKTSHPPTTGPRQTKKWKGIKKGKEKTKDLAKAGNLGVIFLKTRLRKEKSGALLQSNMLTTKPTEKEERMHKMIKRLPPNHPDSKSSEKAQQLCTCFDQGKRGGRLVGRTGGGQPQLQRR